MAQRTDWNNVIAQAGRLGPSGYLQAVVASSGQGASRAFLGVASDRRRYWIKVPTERVPGRMIAADQIVGRLGALIGAPTCTVALLTIPAELTGPATNTKQGETSIGHASAQVLDAFETRLLNRPHEDENACRYTAFAALYDWTWGDDIQGLEASSDEYRFFSHDHGRYLPPGQGNWTAHIIEDYVDVPHGLSDVMDITLDRDEAARLAARLDAVTRPDLVSALRAVPVGWGVTDHDLESVGYFLETRAPRVAERLRIATGGTA